MYIWTLTSRTALVKLNWIFFTLFKAIHHNITFAACILFSWQINQADFELVKVMQEKEKLSAKIVHSPEKLQVGCYRHKSSSGTECVEMPKLKRLKAIRSSNSVGSRITFHGRTASHSFPNSLTQCN